MVILRVTPTIGLPIQARGSLLWGTVLNGALDSIDSAFLSDRNRLTSLESINQILPLAIVSKIGHNILRNNTFERGILTNTAQAVFWPSQFLNGATGFSTRDNTTAVSGTWSNRVSLVYVDPSPMTQTRPYPGLNMLDPIDDQTLANTDQRQLLNGFGYLFQTASLLPYTTYTLSCYGKPEIINIPLNINARWKIGIVFKDTSSIITHSYFSQPQTNSTNSTYPDSFARTEFSFRTPNIPIVSAEVWLVAEGTTPSSIGSVWFDGVQLEQSSRATALDTFSMQGANLFVDGDLTVGGKLALQQDDLVFDSNKVTFLGNVQIGDDITIDTLEVFTKSSIFYGPLTVLGKVVLGDDPLVDEVDVIAKKTTFFNNQDTITPQGGDVEIQGNLDVKGNTILGDNSLTDTVVINALLTTANTSLNLSGDLDVGGVLRVQRAVELGNNFLLDGLTVKMSDLGSTFEGDVYLKNDLKVDGDVTLGDALTDTLYVKAGNTDVSGSVKIDKLLWVYGPVNFDIGNSISDDFTVNSNRTDIVATAATTLTTPQLDLSGNLIIGNSLTANFSSTNASVGASSNVLTGFDVYSDEAFFSKDGYFGGDLEVVGDFSALGDVFVLGPAGNVFSANAGIITLGNISAISGNLYSNSLRVYAGTTYFGDFSSQVKGHVNIGGDLSAAGNIILGSSISEDTMTLTASQLNINVGTYLKVGGGFQNNTYNPLVADHGGLTIDNKGNLSLDGKLTVKGPFDPTSIVINPLQADGYNVTNVLTVYSPTLIPTTTFNLTSSGKLNVATEISVDDGYAASINATTTSFGHLTQTLSNFEVHSPTSTFFGDLSTSDLSSDNILAISLELDEDLLVQRNAIIQGNITSNGTNYSFGAAPSLTTSMQFSANNITLGLDGQSVGDVIVGNHLFVRNDLIVGTNTANPTNDVAISGHTIRLDTASDRPGGIELAGVRIGGGFQDNVYDAFALDHGGVTIDKYGNIFADGSVIARGDIGFDSLTLTTPVGADPTTPVLTVVNDSTGDGYTTFTIDGFGNLHSDACIVADECIISYDYAQVDGHLVLNGQNTSTAPAGTGLGLTSGTSSKVFIVKRFTSPPVYSSSFYGAPFYGTSSANTLEMDDVGNLWSAGYIYTQQASNSNLATYSRTVGDGYLTFGDNNSMGVFRPSSNPIASSIAALVLEATGGTIFVKSGTYVLNANLTIPSNVSIRGEEGTIIDGAGLYGVILSANTKLENVKLQNCTTAVTIAASRVTVSHITIATSTNAFNVSGNNNIITACQATVSGTLVSNTGSSNHILVNEFMYSHFSPGLDNTYDLGSTSLRWKSVHVGPGSLVVHGDNTNTKKLSIEYAGSTASFTTDAASSMNWKVGSTVQGSVSTTGAWTLGPAGGATATSLTVNGAAGIITSNNGGHALTILNSSNGASATTALRLFGGGAAAASAHVMYYNGVAATNWIVGCKNSDNTFNFALSGVENLSTGILGTISTAGAWTLGAASTTPTHQLNTANASTVGAAGGASALPATPTGYITININGTDRKIPYYAT